MTARRPTVPDVIALVEAIRPLMAGKHPSVQGAALAELLSLWLAGHPKEMREALWRAHNDRVSELIPVNAALLRGEA